MAKIKLRLSSKSTSDDNSTPKQKIKIKQPKQEITPSIHRISLKTKPSSDPPVTSLASSSLPTIKLKTTRKIPTIRVKPTRIPGEGYDSEDPDREDDPLVEDGIILRMLSDESLDILRFCVESGDMSGIVIKWKDKRRAVLKINGVMYAGKLIDLPTITEIHKSIDRKNIFKTLDVCQILLIIKRIEEENEALDVSIDKEYGETYPDGLTPPMEHAKQKFTKKYQEKVIQNVEDEVARLLKLDEEAESSTYEFIDPNDKGLLPMGIIEGKMLTKKTKKEKKRRREQEKNAILNTAGDDDLDLDDELDRLMEEEEEEDEEEEENGEEGGEEEAEEDDAKTEIDNGEAITKSKDDDEEEEDEEEENGDEQEEIIEKIVEQDEEEDEEDEDDEEDDDEEEEEEEEVTMTTGGIIGGDFDETKQHNAILLEEISELEATIEHKIKDLNKAINPIMKSRINDVINRLKQELDIKKSQIVEQKTDDEDENENEQREDVEDEDEDEDADGEEENEEDDVNEDNDEEEDEEEQEEQQQQEEEREEEEEQEEETAVEKEDVRENKPSLNDEDENIDEDDLSDLF